MKGKCNKCEAPATHKGMGYQLCDKHNEEFEAQLEEDQMYKYALEAEEERVVAPVYYEEYPFSDESDFDDEDE